jgi:hypothetical protein
VKAPPQPESLVSRRRLSKHSGLLLLFGLALAAILTLPFVRVADAGDLDTEASIEDSAPPLADIVDKLPNEAVLRPVAVGAPSPDAGLGLLSGATICGIGAVRRRRPGASQSRRVQDATSRQP